MSIESYPNPNGVLTSLIWRKTMSGAETSLSGYDNASQALSYTPGQEQVYLNGILLVRGDDYTATNGTSITGLSALAASDYVQVNCYNNFSVASVPAQNITGTVTNAQLANSAITINGSAISLGGTVTLAGDIESVTATSPLTGGGSTGALTVGIQSASTTQSGAVQLSDSTSTTSSILAATPTAVKSAYDLANGAIPKTLTTTTGDIIYASSANTPARLGIGSTGQSLVVTAGVPSWATPASGSMTLLSTTPTTSGTVIRITDVSQAYKKLHIRIMGVQAASNGILRLYQNNTIVSTYFMQAGLNAGTIYNTNTQVGIHLGANVAGFSHYMTYLTAEIDNYANTNLQTYSVRGMMADGGGPKFQINIWGACYSPINVWNELTFKFDGGAAFTGGSIEVYGVN